MRENTRSRRCAAEGRVITMAIGEMLEKKGGGKSAGRCKASLTRGCLKKREGISTLELSERKKEGKKTWINSALNLVMEGGGEQIFSDKLEGRGVYAVRQGKKQLQRHQAIIVGEKKRELTARSVVMP